jgi:hypothetical protein
MMKTMMYVMWIRETGWPTAATPSAIAHEVDEGSFLPSVTPGYSERLHSFYSCGGKNT